MDVHVSNLRRKLAAAGARDVITTVRGVGYRVNPDLR
ncbi:winged helix-turn-helix domain-containing protein [Actinosynnema sp. NPDC059797]